MKVLLEYTNVNLIMEIIVVKYYFIKIARQDMRK